MRRGTWFAWAFVATLGASACASAPPPPPTLHDTDTRAAALPEPSARAPAVIAEDAPSPPSSSATYEQAIAKPEPIDVSDDRAQLTDVELRAPMRGVLNGCRVPANARVTIKTAVQGGRAVGVTVEVRLEKPKSARASRAAARAEAKAVAKITTCIDRNTRAATWPANRRRDSFTTEF